MGIRISDSIEEISIATPITFARYLGTPQGNVYGYTANRWDGYFPRVLAQEEEYTIKGLRFCGGHSTMLDGYSQSYLSGAETARLAAAELKKEGQ
jgi:prolycopene isomerase